MSSGSEATQALPSPPGPAAGRARAEAVAERMRRDPVRWRRHQWEAVHAVRAVLDAGAREGRARCWAVLPPGAGKTYLGVAIARAALEEGSAAKVVVLVPTTAVQGQWVRSAEELGMSAATDRSMAADLTVLTFQAVAVMLKPTGDDPDDPDVDPEGDPADMPEEVDGIADAEVVARLHVNGSDLVARMMEMPDIFVVLDESHHLLEAWGELLVAMLDHLPTTGVLGLTGTPRESLVGAQRLAVDRLFGTVGTRRRRPRSRTRTPTSPTSSPACTPTAPPSSSGSPRSDRCCSCSTSATTCWRPGASCWWRCSPGCPRRGSWD